MGLGTGTDWLPPNHEQTSRLDVWRLGQPSSLVVKRASSVPGPYGHNDVNFLRSLVVNELAKGNICRNPLFSTPKPWLSCRGFPLNQFCEVTGVSADPCSVSTNAPVGARAVEGPIGGRVESRRAWAYPPVVLRYQVLTTKLALEQSEEKWVCHVY